MALRETIVPATRRGGIVLERSIRFERGVAMLRQRFVGEDTRVIVTHEGSLRATVEILAGEIAFGVAGSVIAPPRFVLSVPPRSVLVVHFRGAEAISDGAGAPRALDGHRIPALEPFTQDLLAASAPIVTIDPDAAIPTRIALARRTLHMHLRDPAPVRRAAAIAGMAPETLTRGFARAYGIAPKQYCHRARLFDAALRLLAGASVVDAALTAGFNDLSRFYAQFRGLLGATPGRYARIRNRQDRARRAT